MLARTDAAQMRQRDHETNRAVAAHLERPDVVEEEDARDARLVRRLHEQRADNHIRPARFIHDGGTKTIMLFAEDLQLLRHRAATKVRPPTDNDASRFAARVGIDDLDAFHF